MAGVAECDECGGVWRSVAECGYFGKCGGVWRMWSGVECGECGGVWRSVASVASVADCALK